MQIAVVEFARHVAGMDGANSTEFDPETPFPVVDLLPEQKEVTDMGGTMRLGADPVKLHEGTRAREIFGEAVIYKRHRHRYEVNNMLRRRLEDEGLVASGTSPDERLVEMVELPDHPFFVASQFHPEFNSRPTRPEPLFRDFVGAAARRADRGPGGPATEEPEVEAGTEDVRRSPRPRERRTACRWLSAERADGRLRRAIRATWRSRAGRCADRDPRGAGRAFALDAGVRSAPTSWRPPSSARDGQIDSGSTSEASARAGAFSPSNARARRAT